MPLMRADRRLPAWTAVLLLLWLGAGTGLCLLEHDLQEDMPAAHATPGHFHGGLDVCSRVPVVAAVSGALVALMPSAESLVAPEVLRWVSAHPRPVVPPPKIG